MYELPSTTEVRRNLPKAQLYRQYGWKPSQRESLDGAVVRLDFVAWIAPKTVPAIAPGAEVKEIYVIDVEMKHPDFDPKSITSLAKSIPQRVVYALRYGDSVQLAVYHDKLFAAPSAPADDVVIPLNGLTLDTVWQNIVSTIGNFSISADNSLSEQIKADTERAKVLRQIELLEQQMRSTAQPRRQREIYSEIKKLKSCLR